MKKFTVILGLVFISSGCYWQKGNGNYDVYVDPNFTSAAQDLIKQSIQKWQDSVSYSDGTPTVTFHYTSDWNQKSNLITISPSSIQALTNLYGNKEGKSIVVGYTAFEGTSSMVQVSIDQYDHNFIQCTEHELGHALGLGHTLLGELMFHDQEYASQTVTCRDIEQFCEIWNCNAFELNGCK